MRDEEITLRRQRLAERRARGFVVVPRVIANLPPKDRRFLLWLWLRAEWKGPEAGEAKYNRAEAAEDLGLSIQQIRSAERRLADEDWIVVTPGQHPDNTPYLRATIIDYNDLGMVKSYQQQPVNTRSTSLNKEELQTANIYTSGGRQNTGGDGTVEPRSVRCPFCDNGINQLTGEQCDRCEGTCKPPHEMREIRRSRKAAKNG